MFLSKCHLSALQHSVNYPLFFLRLPLKCDCGEWRWAKPLNKVGVQREKPISPALSETLREQDRMMRMNGRPPTHKLVHSACIQFCISVFFFFPLSVFILFFSQSPYKQEAWQFFFFFFVLVCFQTCYLK